MRFKVKKIFILLSLSVIGLIFVCDLTVNAQTTPPPSQSQCSISPIEKTEKLQPRLKLDKDGKLTLDKDGNPIPVLDKDGNPIPALDKDGNPIRG